MRTYLHRQLNGVSRVAAVAVLVSAAASASAGEKGDWYAGAAYTETNAEVWRGFGWEVSPESSGEIVRGGVRVSKHFAVDFGLLHTGDLEWREGFASVPEVPGTFVAETTFDTTALQVSAVGIAPFGRIWEAYAKGGVVFSQLSGQQTLRNLAGARLLTRSVSDSGTGYLLGFGVGVTVAPGWHLNAEVQSFAIDERFLGIANGNDATLDSFAIGVEHRFGQRSQGK